MLAGGARPGVRELSDAVTDRWTAVVPARSITALSTHLDAGEESTSSSAIEHLGSSLALMDEMLGRPYAGACGLDDTGLAGALLAAKPAAVVHSVRPFLECLEESNFRLSKKVVLAIIEEAEELQGKDDRGQILEHRPLL